MSEGIIYPKLRFPIDIRLEKIGNDEIILINCPIGISKAPLALIPAIGPVLACFEGSMSDSEILNKFQANGLTPELLSQLIKLLDENLFLANSNTAVSETPKEGFRPLPSLFLYFAVISLRLRSLRRCLLFPTGIWRYGKRIILLKKDTIPFGTSSRNSIKSQKGGHVLLMPLNTPVLNPAARKDCVILENSH